VLRLINRLRPAPLESLGSLLERLGEANHYRERGWLGGLLRRHPEWPEVLRRVEDFQTLEALTGLSQDTLIGLTLHRFAPWYGVMSLITVSFQLDSGSDHGIFPDQRLF